MHFHPFATCRFVALRAFVTRVCRVHIVLIDMLTRPFFQACLNAPEPPAGNENGVDGGDQVESPEEPPSQHIPPQTSRPGMPQNAHMPPSYMPSVPMDPQQALAYQSYMQQRNQGYGAGMPSQPGMPPSNHHQS